MKFCNFMDVHKTFAYMYINYWADDVNVSQFSIHFIHGQVFPGQDLAMYKMGQQKVDKNSTVQLWEWKA